MAVIWYDNLFESDPDDPEWYDIERIYCFDWDAFSDVDWSDLSKAYGDLPNFQQNVTDITETFVRWFSPTDDPQSGYLWASVDIPGLQVAGTLRKMVWEDWDQRFQKAIANLPFRKVK